MEGKKKLKEDVSSISIRSGLFDIRRNTNLQGIYHRTMYRIQDI